MAQWETLLQRSLFSHKDQPLNTCSGTQTALGDTGVDSQNFSSTVNRRNRITAEKGKEEKLHFACIIPFPRWECQVARGNPSWKKFPWPGKGEGCEQPAPPTFGALYERPTWVPPSPDRCKAETWQCPSGTRRKGGDYRISHVAGVSTVPSDLLCREPQQLSPLKKATASNSRSRPVVDFTDCCPTGYCVHRCQRPGPSRSLPHPVPGIHTGSQHLTSVAPCVQLASLDPCDLDAHCPACAWGWLY